MNKKISFIDCDKERSMIAVMNGKKPETAFEKNIKKEIEEARKKNPDTIFEIPANL